MTTPTQPAEGLPEPAFRLTWRNGAYRVSEPNIGSTDCYTVDQMRAYAREAIAAAAQSVDLTGYTICPTGNVRRIADELDMGGSAGDAADELRKMVEVSPSLLAATPESAQIVGGEAVAAELEKCWHPQPCDECSLRAIAAARQQAAPATVMGEFSLEDWSELAKLPKGTRIYTLPPLTAPPSAPVGVEGLVREWRARREKALADKNRTESDGETPVLAEWVREGLVKEAQAYGIAAEELQTLAQQPAAVDGPYLMVDGVATVNGIALDEVVKLGDRYAATIEKRGMPRAAQVFEALVMIGKRALAAQQEGAP